MKYYTGHKGQTAYGRAYDVAIEAHNQLEDSYQLRKSSWSFLTGWRDSKKRLMFDLLQESAGLVGDFCTLHDNASWGAQA